MAVLILYATKSGATEQCAKVLSEELPQSKICNIEIEKPSLEAFDSIILGAGVRDEKIYKAIRDFIKNKDELLNKKMGYYICNEKPKTTEELIEKNFPDDLKKLRFASNPLAVIKPIRLPKKVLISSRGFL